MSLRYAYKPKKQDVTGTPQGYITPTITATPEPIYSEPKITKPVVYTPPNMNDRDRTIQPPVVTQPPPNVAQPPPPYVEKPRNNQPQVNDVIGTVPEQYGVPPEGIGGGTPTWPDISPQEYQRNYNRMRARGTVPDYERWVQNVMSKRGMIEHPAFGFQAYQNWSMANPQKKVPYSAWLMAMFKKTPYYIPQQPNLNINPNASGGGALNMA